MMKLKGIYAFYLGEISAGIYLHISKYYINILILQIVL